jgi:hypothetical protein
MAFILQPGNYEIQFWGRGTYEPTILMIMGLFFSIRLGYSRFNILQNPVS